MRIYTQQEVSDITGIPHDTVQGWVKNGLLQLSLAQRVSRGLPRSYIAPDIVQLAIIKKLSNLAFSRRLIRQLADFLVEPEKRIVPRKKTYLDPDRISDKELVTLQFRDDNWQIIVYDMVPKLTDTAPNILKDTTTLVVININKVVEEMRDRL